MCPFHSDIVNAIEFGLRFASAFVYLCFVAQVQDPSLVGSTPFLEHGLGVLLSFILGYLIMFKRVSFVDHRVIDRTKRAWQSKNDSKTKLGDEDREPPASKT